MRHFYSLGFQCPRDVSAPQFLAEIGYHPYKYLPPPRPVLRQLLSTSSNTSSNTSSKNIENEEDDGLELVSTSVINLKYNEESLVDFLEESSEAEDDRSRAAFEQRRMLLDIEGGNKVRGFWTVERFVMAYRASRYYEDELCRLREQHDYKQMVLHHFSQRIEKKLFWEVNIFEWLKARAAAMRSPNAAQSQIG